MRQFKWFWITFCCWCLIGAAAAWALIYSPFHLDSKTVSKLNAEINGTAVQSRILMAPSSMALSRKTIDREWETQGWQCTSGGLNLAAVLLRIPKEYMGSLNDLAQVQMFERKDSYRLLGLWNDCENGRTYQWITEVSKKALTSPKPSDVDFPLKPPAGASNILVIKQEKIEACFWSQAAYREPQEQFLSFYVSAGFGGRLWSQKPGESVYILYRGSAKLLAVIQTNEKNNLISLVKLSTK